ncbi:serine hydrolase domain-containing protein [Streptomyces kanamyceticus]|nr:serine hydrolase domain-containing protein [Streptomyces kanamyceticus]
MTSLAAVVLAASTGLTAAASTGLTHAARPRQADPLQQEVDAIHDTGAVGVSAEVTSPDADGTARAGTAEAGTERPMPRDGRFRIGSATKTFTATVVLQLVEEGRMSLEDTVERWLPGVVEGKGNDGRKISVRQLLQHTSGIPDIKADIPALNSAKGYRAERFRTYAPGELVAMAMRHGRTFPPGKGWSYSNTNYILAAMIIEKAAGGSWADEVKDRIIRPLGMEHTSAPDTFPFIRGPHARGYAAFGTGTGTRTGIDVTTLDPSMAVGSGSIISTTHDLNRFYAALLGGRLLDPARLDEMTTTMTAPELGVAYGLGIAEIELPCGGSYFGHVGELLGYRMWSGVTRDGSRSAVVYATGDGGKDTGKAMSALVGQELCRTR